MQFEVKTITDKNIWQNFLLEQNEKTFLQSWNWGEFEKAMGEKVWRLGVFQISNFKFQIDNNNERKGLVAVAQVVLVEARRGRFIMVPHGPIIVQSSKLKVLDVLLKELKEIAKQEKCGFIRIAPIWERNDENEKIFRDLGFRQAPMHTHPELTWILDISKGEEEILAGMRKTTRYLIKQGLKCKDLEILKSRNVQDVEVFNKLYQETVARHHFTAFSLNYLRQEFLAFAKTHPFLNPPPPNGRGRTKEGEGDALIFLAKYKGEPIAAAIVIFWQGIGFYHQGASSQKYSKIPASYLLQWEAIKEAERRGCKTYNFWGIADIDIAKCRHIGISKYRFHPWTGLTLFKMGFGGKPKVYVKTQDLPLSKRYWLTYLFEKIRKKKRGF